MDKINTKIRGKNDVDDNNGGVLIHAHIPSLTGSILGGFYEKI